MKTILMNGVVMLGFCLILGGAAKADSFTAGDVFLTGNVTGTQATLTIECLDSGCSGWYLGDVTLKGFTFTSLTGTGGGTPAGFAAQVGGQNNSAVGTGGGCNGTQPTGAICWDAQNIPLSFQLAPGVTYTFTADISSGVPGSPLHVQATAYNNASGGQTSGGKVFAISDDLLTTTTVPEPSGLVLLGVGLLGLAGLAGRKQITA